jgi:hypothetical protein
MATSFPPSHRKNMSADQTNQPASQQHRISIAPRAPRPSATTIKNPITKTTHADDRGEASGTD